MIQLKIDEKIKQKKAELRTIENKLNELNMQLREGQAYIQALEELRRARLYDSEKTIRAGSDLDKVYKLLESHGKPLHISEIFNGLGREMTRASRASLTGSLSWHVRRDQIFTRTAPNTFGLKIFSESTPH